MHSWKKNTKFNSAPCEYLKNLLKEFNISFIEEYESPVKSRRFKIDIAFPDKLIGIEVNGNQHYNKEGSLKDYYQERHNLIEKEGWFLYEIHYSCCYNKDIIIPIVNQIIESLIKLEFDFINYIPQNKIQNQCISCNKNIYKYAKQCRQCAHKENLKIDWPSDDELKFLVWNIPTYIIAKNLGISDTAISKRCKNKNIPKPPRGYWEKIYHKKFVQSGGFEPHALPSH